MNLKPIYPPPQTPMLLACSHCSRIKDVSEIKADLDAPGGTFVCSGCELDYELAANPHLESHLAMKAAGLL